MAKPKGIKSQFKREYKAWHAARQRCCNHNNQAFKGYGARGITMCHQWTESFVAFIEDMGACPTGYTLDRIDNDGPYAPDNCRWASMTIQQSNRRITIFATHNGETLTVKEWARRSGEKYRTLLYRLQNGRPIFERRHKKRHGV